MKTFVFLVYFALIFVDIWAQVTELPEDENENVESEEIQNGKIVNGNPAQQSFVPWQVAIRFNKTGDNLRHICGGALISNQWILTAGHCVQQAYAFELILGASRMDNNQYGSVRMGASEAFTHPGYNATGLKNDVALIKLMRPVLFTKYIHRIRLARSFDYLYPGVRVRVSGWGQTHDGDKFISNQLNYVDLVALSNEECKPSYDPGLILNNVVCCDSITKSRNTSACDGDSGGPLTRYDRDGQWTHVGIVSFISSAGCAKGFPTVFARTSSHIGFINFHTGLRIP